MTTFVLQLQNMYDAFVKFYGTQCCNLSQETISHAEY